MVNLGRSLLDIIITHTIHMIYETLLPLFSINTTYHFHILLSQAGMVVCVE